MLIRRLNGKLFIKIKKNILFRLLQFLPKIFWIKNVKPSNRLA